MTNGTDLTGSYTLSMADKNVPNYQPYTLDFHPGNMVTCPLLGQEGRYYYHGDYLMMGFADTDQDFNFPTKIMFFGKFNHQDSFEGVVGDVAHAGVAAWAMAPGHNAPPVFPDFGHDTPLDGKNFQGVERPYDVAVIYQFRKDGQIGIVDYGTPNTGTTLTGKYQTLRYPFQGEQLLVFSNDRMIVYGAVVEEVNGSIELKHGMYMNPFAGGGHYGTWHATS